MFFQQMLACLLCTMDDLSTKDNTVKQSKAFDLVDLKFLAKRLYPYTICMDIVMVLHMHKI